MIATYQIGGKSPFTPPDSFLEQAIAKEMEKKMPRIPKDYDPEFIVICQSAWMNESGFGIGYDWDNQRFNNRNDAIKHGFKLRGSDDFNIAQTYGDCLIWFGWMDQKMDEPAETMAEIAEAIGLTFDPKYYGDNLSKATGRVKAPKAEATHG